MNLNEERDRLQAELNGVELMIAANYLYHIVDNEFPLIRSSIPQLKKEVDTLKIFLFDQCEAGLYRNKLFPFIKKMDELLYKIDDLTQTVNKIKQKSCHIQNYIESQKVEK